VVGCVLAGLQARLPESLANGFEVLVAIMLVILGVRAIGRAAVRGTAGPATHHRHFGGAHTHPGDQGHVHVGPWTLAWRPLLVGLVHGLAGSGALTAIVMAELPTVGTRLAYMALFGLGSVAGMAFLTSISGWQLRRLGRSGRVTRLLALVTGTFSVGLGSWWGYTAITALMRA